MDEEWGTHRQRIHSLWLVCLLFKDQFCLGAWLNFHKGIFFFLVACVFLLDIDSLLFFSQKLGDIWWCFSRIPSFVPNNR